MKKLMMTVVVAGTAGALAMPTKDELTKAQPLVAELMAPAMAKFKAAGYKDKAAAAAKVGDASSEFAKAAETEAAKFLLLKGAVNFYTRGEQYDKAAETVAVLQREVKDVPPAVIAEITGKATGKISESKAPKLYAIYRSAKLQVRAADEAKALAAKLKKAKSDALQRKYAEALAVSGDWKTAYAEFAKVSDAKLKEIAAAEAAGNAKSAESGEYWWAYNPAFEDSEDFFKSHAAAYYRKALDAGEITGLKKNIVEQRIAGVVAEIGKSEEDGAQLCQKQTDGAKIVDSKEILDAVAKLSNGNEKVRTVVGMMFPGWSLDTEGVFDDFGGFRPSHRGQNNVLLVHPPNRETPVVLSRTVALSEKNPCLFLKVSSFDKNSDFWLSVRVDDKDVLFQRLIVTPDWNPWEDLVVPLHEWRGRTVKIEVVSQANNWWCEHTFYASIAIAEGTGQERCGPVGFKEGKTTIGSHNWSYRVKNGETMIFAERNGYPECAVSSKPNGELSIPEKLGGAKVTHIGRAAFRCCSGLTSIAMPASVTHIGRDAFADCTGLTSVTIPPNVRTLEWGAFFNCAGLTSVTMLAERPDAPDNVFQSCGKLKAIHVPAKAKSWAGMTEWQGRPLVFDAK